MKLHTYECVLACPNEMTWTTNLDAYSFTECLKLLDDIRITMIADEPERLAHLRVTKIAEV